MSEFDDLRNLGLVVRPLDVWPSRPAAFRARSPFAAAWTTTAKDLRRELRALDATNVVLNLALRDRDLRLDGLPKANARVEHPGVILAFDSAHGALRYHTDAFLTWRENLRGIALGMESLRRVERYGIAHDGQQYRGYREIEAQVMTADEARAVLREAIGRSVEEHLPAGLDDRSLRTQGLKAAHPDLGGDPDLFERVKRAVRVLQK